MNVVGYYNTYNAINELVDDVMGNYVGSARTIPSRVEKSNDGNYTIVLEIPGLGKDDIEISIDAANLIIKGKKGEREVNKTYKLPKEVDNDNIKAKCKDGVLTIMMERIKAAKPKVIDVTG